MEKQLKWLEERRKGIGGSDAPAICGVSPWKTPYQVWLEKRGESGGQEDNDSMFWGRTLEPVIRQRYADLTGRRVIVPAKILVHPSHPVILASLDGITDDDRVLEVKTARSATGWGEPGTDEIPEHYIAQVQHYLAVTGFIVADVAVLIGGSDFRVYEVPENKEIQNLIMKKELEFWGLVENDTPPDPVSFTDLKIRFGSFSKSERVQASTLVISALNRIQEIKFLSKEEEALKAIVMKELGEADTLVDGDKVLATWKAAKSSKKFNLDAFKAEYPEIYESFLVEGKPSRRFLLK